MLADTRDDKGLSLADLRDAAETMGVALEGWEMSLERLLESGQPAIMHFTTGHFATLVDVSDGMVRWLDGGTRFRVTPLDEVAESYSGYCLLPSPDRSAAGPPQLTFDRFDFDAGDVGAQTVEHVFRCRNRSTQPVRLGTMATSPNCVVNLPDAGQIEPDGSCRIRLTAPGHHRRFVHWVELGTTDPVRPVVYLTLRGGVPTAVTAAPTGVALTCGPGEQVNRIVWLMGPPELDVRRIQSDANFVVAETDDRHTERDRLADAIAIPVLVRVLEGAPIGWAEAKLTIETNDARTPVLRVPVRIRKTGRLHSTPSQAYFGFVKQGTTVERTIVLSQRTGDRLPAIRATCDLPCVSVGVPARQQDGTYAATVALDTRGRLGRIEGSIELVADAMEETRMVVPVYAHIYE